MQPLRKGNSKNQPRTKELAELQSCGLLIEHRGPAPILERLRNEGPHRGVNIDGESVFDIEDRMKRVSLEIKRYVFPIYLLTKLGMFLLSYILDTNNFPANPSQNFIYSPLSPPNSVSRSGTSPPIPQPASSKSSDIPITTVPPTTIILTISAPSTTPPIASPSPVKKSPESSKQIVSLAPKHPSYTKNAI